MSETLRTYYATLNLKDPDYYVDGFKTEDGLVRVKLRAISPSDAEDKIHQVFPGVEIIVIEGEFWGDTHALLRQFYKPITNKEGELL